MAEVNEKRFTEEQIKTMKMPPFSQEAEQSIIGGLMLDNEAWDKVSTKIHADDFYRKQHRLIFRLINKLAEKNTPFDVITISDALENESLLDDAGGLSYLTQLARNTSSVANIGVYADIVREKSILRQLLGASNEITEKVFKPEGASSQDILDEAERKVFAISETGSRESSPVSVQDIVPSVVDRIDELMKSEGGITGVATHYKDLDKMTSGLQGGDMVIIAGRPSMGKTSLAMNIAENVAMDAEKPVLVFSLEMPKESLMMRMLSSVGRVSQTDLRSGKLDDQSWSSVFSTMSLITERMKMHIDDTASLSPSEIRSRSRRLAREHGGLSLIVIDYLQLMQIPGGSENRVNEVSEISRNIKALAKELNVPVIALSQLSRKSEDRHDKRPMMSDLRESGAIEQDADVIMFVYRDEVYNPESEYKGTAEIIIGKQRNGPIGMVRFTFSGQFCRFDDYAPIQV